MATVENRTLQRKPRLDMMARNGLCSRPPHCKLACRRFAVASQRGCRARRDAERVVQHFQEEECVMQATRGFAVSVRSRGRLIGSFAALAVLLAAFLAPSAASAAQPPVTEQYLALG